jgi:hypothetical protein
MSDTDKWTAIVYNNHDKIAHRTFTGDEETVNKEAKEWADTYFPDDKWSLHHQSAK